MYNALLEKLRVLKIDPSHRGVMYIQYVLEGKMKLEDLNDDQIQLIVDVWDSRNYIPKKVYEKMAAKKGNKVVRQKNTEDLPLEEYHRIVAANIINFFAEDDDE